MNRIKNHFSKLDINSWTNPNVGIIKFKGGIFALEKIKKGFKKVKVYA